MWRYSDEVATVPPPLPPPDYQVDYNTPSEKICFNCFWKSIWLICLIHVNPLLIRIKKQGSEHSRIISLLKEIFEKPLFIIHNSSLSKYCR